MGSLRKLLALVVYTVLLAGCAGARGMMITEDTAFLTVLGRDGDDPGRVIDKAVMEAARYTQAHGFRYFAILDAANANMTAVRVEFGQRLFAQPISPQRSFAFVPPSQASTPRMLPDQTVMYVRLGLDITIRMYREGDIDPQTEGIWRSDSVLAG